MDFKRIEEVSLNAWPALQQLLFDGWILRFSRGYTKRANSVNALYDSCLGAEDKIETCESLYTSRGLPTIFRLTPFSQPPCLDKTLADRNYRKMDRTDVLFLDLASCGLFDTPAGRFEELDLDEWLATFHRLSQTEPVHHLTHREILQSIPSRRLLATLLDGHRPVACGLGVLEGTYFGLFDLITLAEERGKGHGTNLVSGMLRWARNNDARQAYLQVTSENVPAHRLYARFGFQQAYQYWYRLADSHVNSGPNAAEQRRWSE